MKITAPIAALLLSAALASADGEAHFQTAAKAAAAKDFATALNEFEAALSENPDSVKFASEYRMTVIQAKEHDRCIKFFEKLVADHPKSASAYLNYGFAYVDKIPVAGTITQVILANTALANFSKSLELDPTWIGYYTRGNSYLFWPKIFGRTPLGVADLEQAMKLQKADKKRPYHARAYISLGDAYWKMDDLAKAKTTWEEGLSLFPDSTQLKDRLAREGDELKTYIEDALDPSKRVDTNLVEFWTDTK
jgi:tetratricopeptide (TPR) repeat protein